MAFHIHPAADISESMAQELADVNGLLNTKSTSAPVTLLPLVPRLSGPRNATRIGSGMMKCVQVTFSPGEPFPKTFMTIRFLFTLLFHHPFQFLTRRGPLDNLS